MNYIESIMSYIFIDEKYKNWKISYFYEMIKNNTIIK